MTDKHRVLAVDKDGFFIGAFEWSAKRKTPTFNPKWVLIDPEHYEEGCENKRWAFKQKVWVGPDTDIVIVDKHGVRRKKKKVFKDRMPPVPAGFRIVTDPEPKQKGAKAYHCTKGKCWKFPERRVMISPDGEENTILVRPDALPKMAKGWKLKKEPK